MLVSGSRVRVSRRGVFLIIFGVVYALLGYSYLTIPAASRPVVKEYLRFALSVLPLDVYGWAWLICGALAVVGGTFHRLDAVGFSAAIFMPTIWAGVYFIAQFDGAPRAWVSAFLFVLLAAAVGTVAGMFDPLDGGPARRPWWPRRRR